MKITHILLISLFLFQATVAFTQEKETEDYTQKIAGSDLVIEMVSIPSGTFTMGSPKNEEYHYKDEGPAHKVSIGNL